MSFKGFEFNRFLICGWGDRENPRRIFLLPVSTLKLGDKWLFVKKKDKKYN
jgi:hypothetical protein